MCSMMSRKVMPRVFSRMPSTSATKACRFAPALPPSAPTLRYRLRAPGSPGPAPCPARAASCSCSIERAPMPRVGKFTTRRKLVSSFGFSISRR